MRFFGKPVVLVTIAVIFFLSGLVTVFNWQRIADLAPNLSGKSVVFENQDPKLSVTFNSTDPALKQYLDQIGIWDKRGIQLPQNDKMVPTTLKGKVIIRLVGSAQENVKTYYRGEPYLSFGVVPNGQDLIVNLNIATYPERLSETQNQQIKQDLSYLCLYVLTRISTKYGLTTQGTTNLVDKYLDSQAILDQAQFLTAVEVLP